ncbi:hypothetical protein ABZ922_43175 [Streptomyces shenzhenensis]|uniref:hypothetical protein n=1 Tax=Streptomyces shenzhenensis TaxID=943815 RepID=UPI0033CE52F5
MREVVPTCLPATDTTGALAPLCWAIGEGREDGLVARRYVLPGDRRALHGAIRMLSAAATGVGWSLPRGRFP